MKSDHISTRLERIATHARQMPELSFTSLNHHLDLELLREAYRRTNRKAAAGVDGVVPEEYEQNLEENLQALLGKAKTGSYHAPPVRRKHIPKGTGSQTRPIGIPTLEDRTLQGAVRMILEAIYEEDFMDFSYGFRRKRGAHMALEVLWKRISRMGGCWLLDVDVTRFFDTLDHKHLRNMLDIRVRDGVLRRLIHKWLHAGVMEDGNIHYPESGTPQGGAISPLLANIYLHEVLDKWFEDEIKPRLNGRAFMVRYADDFVMGFETKEEAEAVMDELEKRFARHGLALHPTKTRLVDFRKPRDRGRQGGRGLQENRTFDFLSFTHYWGLSRKGNRTVQRKTARKRFARAVSAIDDWCRKHRHQRVKQQCKTLRAKVRGHYLYFGITGNFRALARFRWHVERAWRKWLNRRSQKRKMPWKRFKRLLRHHPLPRPRVYQSVFKT